MTAETPYIPAPPEAEGNYKYYLLGTRSVRVEYDNLNRPFRAEAPDGTSGGELKANLSLLGRVIGSSDAEQINRSEFIEACSRAKLKKNAEFSQAVPTVR